MGGGHHHGGGGGHRGGGRGWGPGWPGPGWGPWWDYSEPVIYSEPVVIVNQAPVPAPVVAAPAAKSTAGKAQAALARLKRSLTQWLDYRGRLDEIVAGTRVGKTDAATLARTLAAKRPSVEQPLANHLYNLLSQVFDASALPSPDVSKDPDAAVKLAQIALSGTLPSAASAPTAPAGWLWPVLIVGGIVLAISIVASNAADVAREQAQLDCIKQGACTDSSFWLKMGGVAVAVWFVWDWLGVGKRVRGIASRRRR